MLILPDIEIHCDHEARCERRRDADIGEFTGVERLDIVILCEHIQDVFGLDLYEAGLGEQIESMVKELYAGKGAVRATLHKYVAAR